MGRCLRSRDDRGGTVVRVPHRGDVWWLEDPEAGRRPALVLSGDVAIDVLTSLLVAPITRTVRGIPTEVELGLSQRLAAARRRTRSRRQPSSC